METPELPFPGHILGTWQVFLAVQKWQSIRSAAFHSKGILDCWQEPESALSPKLLHLDSQGLGWCWGYICPGQFPLFSTFSCAFVYCWVDSNLGNIDQGQGIYLSY